MLGTISLLIEKTSTVAPFLCGSSLLKEANHYTFRTSPREHWTVGMSMACSS